MKTMDILESKIKETLSEKTKLQIENQNLVEEIVNLREDMKRLETEKENIRIRLDAIIEKVELYLSRSEA